MSFAWLNVEKPRITFSYNFWFLNDYRRTLYFKLTGVLYRSAPTVECHIASQWDVPNQKNDINIAKPCIHRAAGSGINYMIFPSFSWRLLLWMFINHEPGLDKYCAPCTASMPIYSCERQKIHVHLFPHCILLFVDWVPLVFLVSP